MKKIVSFMLCCVMLLSLCSAFPHDVLAASGATNSIDVISVGTRTLDIDNKIIRDNGLMFIDDGHDAIQYGWPYEINGVRSHGASTKARGGQYISNLGQVSATISYQFEGNYIAVAFMENYYAAEIIVSIDGVEMGSYTPFSDVYKDINKDAPSHSVIVYVTDELSSGTHTITVRLATAYTSGDRNLRDGYAFYDNYAFFDGFIVRDPATLQPDDGGEGQPSYEPNQLPTFNIDKASMLVNMNSSAKKIFSATDADGDTIAYRIFMQPKNGQALITDNGETTYIPVKDYYGHDYYVIGASDGRGREILLLVEINVPEIARLDSAAFSVSPNHTLTNALLNMGLGGQLGDTVQTLEKEWLHSIFQTNPRLFYAFNNPTASNIFKTQWHGEYPGKLLTGIAQYYLISGNPETLEIGNKFVENFKKAQKEDGYLGPWATDQRFDMTTDIWDTWGHYHCIYGLLQWYLVTGNEDALEVAKKASDCVYDYFITNGHRFVDQNWGECNFAISHSFALLHSITGEEKYLKAAQYIVETEWTYEYHDYYTNSVLACNWLSEAAKGTPFCKTPQKRWESLHTLATLAELYTITENTEYYRAMENYWWSIVGYDRHNIGSFGTAESSNGNPYGLMTETCNTVAWMAFSTEYLKISQQSYVADELEMSYYNATLGSLVGDREFIYANNSSGDRVSLIESGFPGQSPGILELSCCQTNGARGISQISQWALLRGEEDLYLNFYGESAMQATTPGGHPITLTQKTAYPSNGDITITLDMEQAEVFKLNLRIPTWTKSATVSVNGTAMPNVLPGQYFTMEREWKSGDTIEIKLDMTIHFWASEQRDNTVSMYYGPLLLAMESNSAISYSPELTYESLLAFTPDGKQENCFITGTVKGKDGSIIRLVDYASAGDTHKGGKPYYTTWLTCDTPLGVYPYVKGQNPIWNNTEDVKQTFTVSAEVGEHGSISATDSMSIPYGGHYSVTAVADEGYELDRVYLNGELLELHGAGNEIVLASVRSDSTLLITFKEIREETETETDAPETEIEPASDTLPNESETLSGTTEQTSEDSNGTDKPQGEGCGSSIASFATLLTMIGAAFVLAKRKEFEKHY